VTYKCEFVIFSVNIILQFFKGSPVPGSPKYVTGKRDAFYHNSFCPSVHPCVCHIFAVFSSLKSCKGYRGAGGFKLRLSEQVFSSAAEVQMG